MKHLKDLNDHDVNEFIDLIGLINFKLKKFFNRDMNIYIYEQVIKKEKHDIVEIRHIELREFIELIEQKFNLEPNSLKSKTRNHEIRHIANCIMYLFRNEYGKKITSTFLGRMFERDHSTILHSLNTIQDLIDLKNNNTGNGNENADYEIFLEIKNEFINRQKINHD